MACNGDHGVGVDLAHVVAPVLRGHLLDVEAPRVVVVVLDLEPRDPGDDALADRQDHLPVDVHPGHLAHWQRLSRFKFLYNEKCHFCIFDSVNLSGGSLFFRPGPEIGYSFSGLGLEVIF